jgi:hypothetical protein
MLIEVAQPVYACLVFLDIDAAAKDEQPAMRHFPVHILLKVSHSKKKKKKEKEK